MHSIVTRLDALPSRRIVNDMGDCGFPDDMLGPQPSCGRFGDELLTLALLEDLAALLQRHGYPPLRGHDLAELTAVLARLQFPHG